MEKSHRVLTLFIYLIRLGEFFHIQLQPFCFSSFCQSEDEQILV